MVTLTPETVADREAELRKQIQDATAELDELAAVKRYMARIAVSEPSPAVFPAPIASGDGPRKQVDSGGAGRVSGLTKTLMSILKSAENPWMTAKNLQAQASAILGAEVKMSSISPKLSELKNTGVIRRDDMLVALTERVGLERIDDLLS